MCELFYCHQTEQISAANRSGPKDWNWWFLAGSVWARKVFWKVCKRCEGKTSLLSAGLHLLSPSPHPLIGNIFMNSQVDKEEKHLAQNIFCRRLNSTLRDYVPYTSHAELWVAVGWFGGEVAFEGNLAVVSIHPNLLPCQHGLSSANWIALPKSTSGVHQMGCDC